MGNLITHLIVLALALYGPRIRLKTKGGNASHNPFKGVSMRDFDHPSMVGQSWHGVLKQEIAEWRAMWLCGVLFTAPSPLLIDLSDHLGFWGSAALVNAAAPIVIIAARMVVRNLTNGLDFFGTNLEIWEGMKTNPDYFEQEVLRLANGDKGRIAEMMAGLKRWGPVSKAFGWLSYNVRSTKAVRSNAD